MKKVLLISLLLFSPWCLCQEPDTAPPFDRVTSDYGPRNMNDPGEAMNWDFHDGIDYNPQVTAGQSTIGTAIPAVAIGEIEIIETSGLKYISIKDPDTKRRWSYLHIFEDTNAVVATDSNGTGEVVLESGVFKMGIKRHNGSHPYIARFDNGFINNATVVYVSKISSSLVANAIKIHGTVPVTVVSDAGDEIAPNPGDGLYDPTKKESELS